MYLIVILISLICITVWALLILNKPKKSEKTRQETSQGDKQFIFSSDRPYIASRNRSKPKGVDPIKPRPETQTTKPPATPNVPPFIKKSPPNTGATNSNSPKKTVPPADEDGLDFDHLSELIDDFFKEEKDSKNFP